MTQLSYYAGIDPGLSGAIAFWHPETKDLSIFDMPTHQVTINAKKKSRLDIYAIGNIFDAWRLKIKAAVLEDVTSSPQMGVVSAFTFGETVGVMKGALAANVIPLHLARPAEWKRVLRLSSDKDASRALASKIAPQHSRLWERKMDDGRAEAFLLAWYGAQFIKF